MSSIDPPWPRNELARLGKLKGYCILDTPPDAAFDRLTNLAARHFHMPIALVTFVDECRQWFLSRRGIDVPSTPRRIAFCAYTILYDQVMVVADATRDERFADNELVTGPPHIRFYAGAPLKSPEGFCLGTFCVIDRVPHHDFDEEAQSDLEGFASIVIHELEMRAAQRAEHEARRQVEHAEARLRAIVDTAVDAIVIIDAAGSIQSFNPAAEGMFGYDSPEVIGCNVRVLMTEVDAPHHDGYLSNYLRSGEPKIIGVGRNVLGRRKNGTVFPVELSVAEWRADGQVFFTGMMRDITEREEAQNSLHRSNALLGTIIESIPDPIFVKDVGGRFILVNDGTCRLFGVEKQQVLGARDADFYPPDLTARIEAADRQVLQTGVVTAIEEQVFNRSLNELRFYWSTKAPLRDAAGKIIGLVAIARDVTERRNSEDGLRAAKATAERANLAKSKFLAATSHDLRQPVQSLVLFLDVIRHQLTGQQGLSLLTAMEQALEGLRMLLDGLLDISKLEAGLVTAEAAPTPLGPLLARLAAEYRLRAESKGLRLRAVVCDALVLTDPILLERMLRNLVENALRYTERGGVLIGCRLRADRLFIQVVDTGIGIDLERHEEIFEEFFQVGNPERDRAKGLGLGLAVVRRLGSLLGHPVSVVSVPGRGSSFCLEVPVVGRDRVVANPVPPESVMPTLAAEQCGATILVVEDEALVLRSLVLALTGWGYQVLAAESASDAMRHLDAGNKPDLILTDYRLRGSETGVQVIGLVCQRLGKRVPAAIITGDTSPERLAEAAAGGFKLLHKPVTAGPLLETVTALLLSPARV